MIKVNDKWLRIALIAVISLSFLLEYLGSNKSNLKANIVYIITTILVCEGSRWLIYRSKTWFAAPHRRLKRLSVLIPSGTILIGILFFFSKLLRDYLAYGSTSSIFSGGVTIFVENKPVKIGFAISALFYAFWVFLAMLAIFEVAYHYARLRQVEKERDRLEKEKLQAELQQLKGIVNPHFLFNNLNSLSSLISENPQRAEEFLDELTKVFRYLLRNNETELTTLEQELEFVSSYYHLLQTRHGKGITMQMNIDPGCTSYLLPPLTLQLLLENAVKHNRVNKEAPLTIEIFSNTSKQLVVRNNLAARDQKIESTGIGLRSINSRYQLLRHNTLEIHKDEKFFSVTIPLIPSGSSSF